MVADLASDTDLHRRAWEAASQVVDPEIPVLTIADLGVLRDVVIRDGEVEVAITPTYSGCPAMNMIGLEIELALVLSHDLPATEIDQQQLLSSIAGVVPALEINGSAFADGQLTLLDAVADNLSSGLYVLGDQRVPVAQLPKAPLLASLNKNGQQLLLDTPIELENCLATGLWLANKMASLGQPLRAGAVLLTGALAPAFEISRGDQLSFQVVGLGAVMCSFC